MKPSSKIEKKSMRLSEREDQLWEEWFDYHYEETLDELHEVVYRRVRILDRINDEHKRRTTFTGRR